jgi:hypothetical protein
MRIAIDKLPEQHHQTGQTAFYGFWLLIAGIFLFTSSRSAIVNLQNDRAINGPFDAQHRSLQLYKRKDSV